MVNNIYILILGMMVVTYLPRLIPFLIMNNKKIPYKFELFLGYIPYAALGALIIPGFIQAIPGHSIVSFFALLSAAIICYFKGGIILPVIASIITCIILLTLGI